jgi:hypothetical protein
MTRRLEHQLAGAIRERDRLRRALEESVRLQSHYAELLNMHDGRTADRVPVGRRLDRTPGRNGDAHAMSLPGTRQLNFFFTMPKSQQPPVPRPRAFGQVLVVTKLLPSVVKRMPELSKDVEIRERVLEELRPGVIAQWCDPLERLGVVRPRMLRAPPSRAKADRAGTRSIR